MHAQSFHFSPRLPGKDWPASEAAHETRLAGLLRLGPGSKCLDVGCGVGGPLRPIACASGAHVTGITINDYQVQRGQYHNKRVSASLQEEHAAVTACMPEQHQRLSCRWQAAVFEYRSGGSALTEP